MAYEWHTRPIMHVLILIPKNRFFIILDFAVAVDVSLARERG
jgi:hypothetical protein